MTNADSVAVGDVVQAKQIESLETEVEELRQENRMLRGRVAALEGALLDSRPGEERGVEVITERALRSRKRLLHTVIDNLPILVFAKDAEGRYILVNRQTELFYGRTRSELLGRVDTDFFSPDIASALRAKDAEVVATGAPLEHEETFEVHGVTRHYTTIKFPIYEEGGDLLGVCGISTDITDRKREEEERLRLRERVIEAQVEVLREVSTPLVPIAEGVVAMPLVGTIDYARADRIVGTLLEGIVHHQAHSVILDITGVRTVDSHVAGTLVAAAKSVRLLGARVVLTGIKPEVARTLVELGADLEGIVTRGNFQSGIAFALRR